MATRKNLLGKGGYGCGFYPAITCLDPNKNRRAVVGKVFYDEDAADIEMTQAKILKNIDPEQKFFLYPTDRCTISLETLLEEGMKCVKYMDDVHGELPRSLEQLLMPNGGKTLSQYLRELTGPMTRVHALKLVRPLFYGVRLLQEHGMVHQDIKPPNIVINDRNRIRLIDWGTAIQDMEMVYSDDNNMYLPAGFDEEEDGLPGSVYCISPPEYRIEDYRKYIQAHKVKASEIATTILHIEEQMIYAARWVSRPLDGWYSYYQLKNATQHVLMDRLYKQFDATTFKDVVPITAADVYGLGFLLLCLSPYLVDASIEDPEILQLYNRLVYHMMKADPRKRWTISEAIEMLDRSLLPRFSRSPVENWMTTEALFKEKQAFVPNPNLMSNRDMYVNTYSRMTVRQLKQTDIYKEITKGKHNKSKLDKKGLVDIIVTRRMATESHKQK